MTIPNRLAVKMDGAYGSGIYKCEITIETPRFVTLELRKNITVIGKVLEVNLRCFYYKVR